MISSRIVSNATDMLKQFGPSWKKKTVTMVTLGDYILGGQLVDIEGDLGPADAFICKIDTEGHEAKVIEGIGSAVMEKMSHALIIEFWPSLLDETVDDVPFGTYALRNYIVYDVQSSLYPRSYDRVESFDGLVSRIHDREVSNIDLLMIRRSMPHLDILLAEIDALRQA